MPLLLIIAIALLTVLGLVRVIVDIKVGSPFRYRPKPPPVHRPPPLKSLLSSVAHKKS